MWCHISFWRHLFKYSGISFETVCECLFMWCHISFWRHLFKYGGISFETVCECLFMWCHISFWCHLFKYSGILLRLFVNVYLCDVISHSGTACLIKYSGKSFESVCECWLLLCCKSFWQSYVFTLDLFLLTILYILFLSFIVQLYVSLLHLSLV